MKVFGKVTLRPEILVILILAAFNGISATIHVVPGDTYTKIESALPGTR